MRDTDYQAGPQPQTQSQFHPQQQQQQRQVYQGAGIGPGQALRAPLNQVSLFPIVVSITV